MTAKKLPAVDTRVTVFQIDGVEWPGKNDGVGLTGTVTSTSMGSSDTWDCFHMLPDTPDPSRNSNGLAAADYNATFGWIVYNRRKWRKEQYVINELSLT